MKRGLSGRTRRGSPPLPRQRRALRAVQVTFITMTVLLSLLALDLYRHRVEWRTEVTSGPRPAIGALVGISAAAIGSAVAAGMMGFRLVKGPRPPELD